MLYLIRDATGKTISTYVEYVGPQADVRLLPPSALRVDVLDHWKSPAIGVNYPSGWHLEVNNQQFQASVDAHAGIERPGACGVPINGQ